MSRRAGVAVVLVLAVFAGAYLTAARRTGGPPLDPGSTARDGARGVVELVDRFAADVAITRAVPDAGVDTALLLQDRYRRDDAAALAAWVDGGGTLVVADPSSSFAPPAGGPTSAGPTSSGRESGGPPCPVPALAGVTTLVDPMARSYTAPPGTVGCVASATGWRIVVEQRGRGTVVAVGGPGVFTNALLGDGDNAALAVALLAPEAGTRSAFLSPVAVGSGDAGLIDLVGDPVRAALAQLVVAFLVVVAWRSRRLGTPVPEPQLVEIDSSELTRAVGRLLARNRRPARAAAVLRDRARRDLSAPLGLAVDAPSVVVVAALVRHTSLTPDEAALAVSSTVSSDGDLVAVANVLVRIREEITRGRTHVTPV